MPPFDASNFFAVLFGGFTPASIAALFGRAGWSTRPSSSTDWEVATTGAELVAEPSSANAVLLHGTVDTPARIAELLAVLRAQGVAHQAESYDSSGEILEEYSWKP
jgi:hypothetical protein